MDDRALSRRVLAGEEAAFEEFFDQFFPRLFRFALARLDGDEDAAEDVTQRVLIRGLAHLRTYRGEAALLTWLCTFCRREVSLWRSRAGGRREVSFEDDRPEWRAALDTLTVADDEGPESQLRRRELSDLVQLTLDHLPGRYGEVLEWKYIEGASVGEIASRLRVGYKAAESLLSRARASFREGFTFVASERRDALSRNGLLAEES